MRDNIFPSVHFYHIPFQGIKASKLLFSTVLLLAVFFQNSIFSQNTSNPFEIISRLDPVVQKKIEEKKATGAPDNPFDIIKDHTNHTPQTQKYTPQITTPITNKVIKNTPIVELSNDQKGFKRFLFITILAIMIVFTLIMTLFRNFIFKAYNAFLNDNLMSQVYREKTIAVSFPYTILYGLFFINAGVFILILTKYYDISIAESNFQSLIYCILGVVIIFFLHHFLLKFTGFIFPISKETGKYSFTIQIFNIIIGIALIPMILLTAYGPKSFVSILLPAFGILLTLVYLYRYLRGLLLANRYLAFHKFHFFLYICAVEIAPFLILIKLLKSEGA